MSEREHDLKVWPEFFDPLESGIKTFELRRDDRGFRVGDVLLLREWSRSAGYSGRQLRRRVSYLICGPGFGLAPDFVCMGLADV